MLGTRRSASLQVVRSLLNQLPDIAKMLLGREHVAETNSHNGAAAQFCLGDVTASRRIDPFDHGRVQDVDRIGIGGDQSEANDAHTNWRRQLKTFVVPDPLGEKFGEPEMIADARSNSFATKRAPDDPGFERAETAAELDAIVHVINFRAHRIAEMQIFGGEGEEPPQPPNVAQVEGAEIERDKEHLVRVDDD